MGAFKVHGMLAERLGPAASAELVDMLEANNRVCVEHVMTQCTERFERRLVEATSKLQVDMVQLGADLRGEMAGLRTEMAGLRTEVAAKRFELLKWAFLFWVGQLVSVVGIIAFMLRR
ncbi:MAG: hypothetical protein WBD07_10925 [Vicinamibacterales bacterium]